MEFDEHTIKLDLAQKIDQMKISTGRLSGAQLISAHKIISSISDRPFEFKIAGPVKVEFPWDFKTQVAGPVADDEIVLSSGLPSNTSSTKIACPKCGHAIEVKLSCE